MEWTPDGVFCSPSYTSGPAPLIASVKHMRVPPIAKFPLLFVALLAAFILVLPILGHPQHFAFRHRSPGYYAEFARACDSLLAQHPIGTNEIVEIPVNDQSIPSIIRQVHPFRIKLATNWVWILAWGEGHADGVGITWEPQNEGQTSVWALLTTAEGHTRTVYVAPR
jgi:hypothetical protein